MKNNKHFIIVDLEATCWNSEVGRPLDFDNEIIEIGAVKLDSEGNEISRFARFSKPLNYPILSDFCIELTTIKQSDIDSADNLKDVLVDFFKWCDGGTLVSWGHYDSNQFKKDLNRNGLQKLTECLNDHQSLKHLHGKWNNLRRGGIGISGALRIEGLSFDGTKHRGICDAVNIAKIFIKYIDKF